MAVWQRFGLSGTAAGVGAGTILLLAIGGVIIVSQQPDRPVPEPIETAQSAPLVAVPQAPAAQTPITQTPEPEPETVMTEPVVSAPETPAPEATQTEAEAEAEAEIEAAPQTAEIETEAEAETSEPEIAEVQTEVQTEVQPETQPEPQPVIAPSFDVVRIDPQGSAVVAGAAAPGAQVQLQAGGEIVAEVTADQNGKFVALFDLGPSETPRVLELLADGASVAGSDTVLISPVQPAPTSVADAVVPEPAPAPVIGEVAEQEVASAPELPETSEEPTQRAVAEVPELSSPTPSVEEPSVELVTELAETAPEQIAAVEPEPETPAATAPRETETAEAGEVTETLEAPETPEAPEETETTEAPTIVVANESGVRVVQPAPRPQAPSTSPDVTTNVVIDTITYDTDGEVALAGRGASDGFVRVYLNEQPIQTTSIETDGSWIADLPEVDAGVYRLRIDEVDAAGTVTSRVETPFKREEPEVVEGTVAAVTVQPGFTLWGIAQERFGDGVQYVRVYEANRDLIRDPDLIYPGQVFALPN